MNLLDEMRQVLTEIDDGRVLYRHSQRLKKDGALDQTAVSEVLDDVETLIRYFGYLRVKAEAEANGVILSEIEPNESAGRARDRLTGAAQKLQEVGG